MQCLALFDSGNYAIYIKKILWEKGYYFEVISTPCKIARQGCGYCMKFPLVHKDLVLQETEKIKIPVREIYIIEHKKYKKIYP